MAIDPVARGLAAYAGSTAGVTAALRQPAILCAFLGPSIYQHANEATSTTPSATGGAITSLSNNARGDITWLSFLSEGRIDTAVWANPNDPYSVALNARGDAERWWKGSNHGISGDFLSGNHGSPSTPGMRARVSDVPPNAHMIWIGSPTNSINSATVYADLAGYLTDALWMIDYFLDRGKVVILDACETRSTALWANASIQRALAYEYNTQMNEYVRQRASAGKRCYFFDLNRAWADYTDANGAPRSGYSSDGIHREVLGAYQIGKLRWKFVQDRFGYLLGARPQLIMPDSYYNASTCPHGFIGDSTTKSNPFFQGSGGTGTGGFFTGTIAQYATLSRSSGSNVTGVCSVVADTDDGYGYIGGNWQQVAVSFGASYEDFYVYPGKTSISQSTLTAGMWVRGFARVSVSQFDSWNRIALNLVDSGTNGCTAEGLKQYFRSAAYSPYPNEAFTGLIQTPPIQITGSGNLNFRMKIGGKTGTGTSTIKIGTMALVPVDDPNTVWGTS